MSNPGVAAQQDTLLKTELPRTVMSRNDPGAWWAIEWSRGGTNPGLGSPDCLACWSHSAIIPATSGAAALVPPTNEIVWPDDGDSSAHRTSR